MAQNFLYMFEFVVDDLLVTRPNACAPEEYPTCCEISFRSSVFVSICDREYGHCVDTCAPKCGKCCLFSLESPVNDKDRLLIHVYKKKTDNCKFLLGVTEMPIKPLFDKVTDNFHIENPNWMESVTRHAATMPDPKFAVSKRGGPPQPPDCDDDIGGRKEMLCPTSELTKALLPLFSMKGKQTGNLTLITRLVCNGPAIVSSFPFSRFCNTNCGCKKQAKPCSSGGGSGKQSCPSDGKVCPMPNPCLKPDNKPPPCRRYFACNDDKGCPCDECEDDRDRECGSPCKKNKKKAKSPSRCCGGGQPNCDDAAEKCCCEECCGMDDCCEAAKARALRKLRYLMQKYVA